MKGVGETARHAIFWQTRRDLASYGGTILPMVTSPAIDCSLTKTSLLHQQQKNPGHQNVGMSPNNCDITITYNSCSN